MRLSRPLSGIIAFGALAAVLAPGTAPAAGGLLDLVPSMTPAVMVVKGPARLGKRLGDFAGLPPSGTAADDAVPSIPGLGPLPDGIDPDGQVVVAMPQFPFPLIILPVSDYGLFMRSLRSQGAPGGGSAPSLPSPSPGIEGVTWNGKPYFVKQEGSHAMISPMPILLNTPPPGTGLSAAMTAGELDVYAGSDFFVRLDVGMILTLVEPFLQPFLQRLEAPAAQPTAGGPEGGEGLDARTRKLLVAEVELLMRGLRQVRSFTAGVSMGQDEASLASLYLPQPGSGFESLLAAARQDRHEFLGYFGPDSAMAGGFVFDDESMGDLVRSISMFVLDSGAYDLADTDRETWEGMIREGMAAAGPRSAWSFGPSPEGAAFSMLVVSEVRDGEKVRALMRDSMPLVEKILLSSPDMQGGMRVEYHEGAESHGGYAIDRLRLLPSTGSEEEDRKMQDALQMVFGASSLDVWFAVSKELMVASYYSSTSGPLKSLIDRITKNEQGGLTSSAAFREATKGLPEKNLSLSFFSLPRFMALFSEVFRKARPGQPRPEWPVAGDQSSGIGVAYHVSGGSLRVDTLVPRQEVRNIRVIFEHLKAMEKKDGPAQGGGTPRPEPF